MIYLAMGDLHTRASIPQNRSDSYLTEQQRKFRWILELATEYHATILQPGDWWDTPRTSYLLWQVYAKMLKVHEYPIYTIFGQHDMRFHTNPQNSPLAALESMDLVHILNDTPTVDGDVLLYGASYNQCIPECDSSKKCILLVHTLIGLEKMWPGQKDEEITIAKDLLEQTDYQLIIGGDNHSAFQEEVNGRFLFNCGSLMRSTIDQYDHQPCVVLIDSDNWEYEVIDVPIKEPAKVFLDIKQSKERDEKMHIFAKSLENIDTVELDYERNLRTHIKLNKVDDAIVTILNEALKDDSPPL